MRNECENPPCVLTKGMLEKPENWSRLQKLLFQFDEPTSRLYHVNILSSLLLVIVVLWIVGRQQKMPLKTLLRRWVLRKKYWWNHSTKQDYLIYFLNALFKSFLFVPLFEGSFHISQAVIRFLVKFNGGDLLDIPVTNVWLLGFTFAVFVWDDFLRFFHHWLMHKIPALWEFHKLHHSARVLTPVTLYRAHPVESILAILRNSVSLGVAIGVFIFLFGSSFSLWTLLGINGFGFIFNLVGANLRHSHIPLGFGPFERFLISPIQHQVHHSKDVAHYDKNFGVSLAIWDGLFGSLIFSKDVQKLKFGLSERFRTSLWEHYKAPFVTLGKKLISRVKRS
ncbi:sterol desaturase family protein [Bdellovibrio bacteriovorus]|uniref:sterol desaturase family protein n=1 Tax=Bdellovibrio TaxID=958 RepID=UPI0035A84479